MEAGTVLAPKRPHTGKAAALLALALTLSSCQAPAPVPPQGPAAPSAVSAGPAGGTAVVATGLRAPWSMVPLADGSLIVSERDSGTLVAVAPDGQVRTVGEVAGVVHQGEGGLLGLAVSPEQCAGPPDPADPRTACHMLFAYYTAESDNRIVRMPLTGTGNNLALGDAEIVVADIPKAGTHNGGRIAFGPDGMLYATTGDAGNRHAAQDPASLSGKILRLHEDGAVPRDNPFTGSPVWTLGHRNPQGIAWDEQGRMWAAEFGQNTWDELNEIQGGGNYGWPVVEGRGGDPRYRDPVLQWTTEEASPSGIAVDGTTLYMTALRGERLWQISLAAEPTAHVLAGGGLGRLRDVTVLPDGRLLVLTNNTDGRGTPAADDDKIVEIDR